MRKIIACLLACAALLAARPVSAHETSAHETDAGRAREADYARRGGGDLAAAHAALPAAAARTTWAPHDVVCPVCKTKNTYMQIMSYGNYIYSWPSRFQYIFWPLTDSPVLYSCKKCRLTAFMGDYEKLPADKLPALAKMLATVPPAAKPFEKYTDIPMSERLAIAERVYDVLGRDDDWWCMFRRVEGYHLQGEKKQAAADEARRKALALAEKMLGDAANEPRRKELVLITGAMKYFLDDEQAALSDFDAALRLTYRDPKNPQGAGNLDKYLTGLLEDYVAAIRDEIKARAEPVWPHRTFEEHRSWVWAAAFSADGRAVASGDMDGALVLRDTETGAVRHTLQHGTAILGAAFSPDGESVVSCGYSGTLKVWDARTGELRRSLPGHTAHVASVAFSRDGKWMATGDWDGALHLWDATGWKIARTIKAGESVRDLALALDGSAVAAVDFKGVIRLWDARTGALRFSVPTNDKASFVALSPDGRWLATDSEGASLVLIDAATGKVARRLAGHRASPSAAAFAPDGARVASVAWDGTLRLWDAATGEQLSVLTERGHHFRVVTFSPDGQTVATGSDDRTFRLWDVRPGTKPQPPPPVTKTPKVKAAR